MRKHLQLGDLLSRFTGNANALTVFPMNVARSCQKTNCCTVSDEMRNSLLQAVLTSDALHFTSCRMIVGFRHKGLRKFYEKNDRSGINPEHHKKVANILSHLNVAEDIKDMDIVTFKLHALTGDRTGTWSVTVRANWRITFTFKNGKADVLDYEDYH